MISNKKPIAAIALSSLVLFGAVSMTTAAPGQKGKKPAAKPASGAPSKEAIAAGAKIYKANGCAACHKIGDAGGALGPDLSKIGADKKWPAAKLEAVIRDPKKAIKSEKMPAYPADKISDKELKSLVAYLGSLK